MESGLDEKDRGIADGLVALAAGALVAAWKLETTPRRPHRLLNVRPADCVCSGKLFVRTYCAPT